MMFIPNVPAVFISSPDQLVVGQELWSVGQGGITSIHKPRFLGKYVSQGFAERGEIGHYEEEPGFLLYLYGGRLLSTSMLDQHILPQTYNNWYICTTQEDACTIYNHMKAVWDNDPAFEAQRNSFDKQTRSWFD